MALLVRFFYSDFKLSAFFFFFYFYDWHFVKRNFTSYTFRKCLNYPTAFFFFFFFFFFFHLFLRKLISLHFLRSLLIVYAEKKDSAIFVSLINCLFPEDRPPEFIFTAACIKAMQRQ